MAGSRLSCGLQHMIRQTLDQSQTAQEAGRAARLPRVRGLELRPHSSSRQLSISESPSRKARAGRRSTVCTLLGLGYKNT